MGSVPLWIRPWAIWHEKTISVNSSLSLIAIAYTFANMWYKLFWISKIYFTNSNYQCPTILSNGGRQPELLFFKNFQWVHKRPRYTVTKPKNRTGNSLFFLTTWRALDASRQRWACASNTVDFTVVSCADPGIFVMGGGGGGGVGGSRLNWQRKKHSDNVFLGISLLRFYRGVQ